MDKLLNLVRSLSAKEKNQYVKFAKQHLKNKEAQKLQLFQLIAKQLRGQIKDYNVQAKDNFSSTSLGSLKTQLYNQLLRSLSFNSFSTARSRASQMIDEIQILMDRGLLKQALTRIEKAKKLIEAHHLHFQYLELSLLHRRIIRQFKTRDVISMLENEQKNCDERLEWINQEFDLLQQYEHYFIQSRISTADQSKLVKPNKTLPKQKGINSFEGKVYYHLLRRQYYRNRNRQKKRTRNNQLIQKETKAILQLFENNPKLKAEKLTRYLLVLYMYLNACIHLEQYDEVENNLAKLQLIPTRNFYEEAQKESTLLLLATIFYFHLEQFEKIAEIADRAWIVIKKYKVFISFERLLSISYNLGVSLFLAGQVDEAWDAFNFCLQKQDYSELKEKIVGKQFGKYIQASAHIYRLIVVQAKNDDGELTMLLRSMLSSAQHFLKQHHISDSTLWQIFNYLRTLINKNAHQIEQLHLLQQQLENKAAFKEYVLWVNSVMKMGRG